MNDDFDIRNENVSPAEKEFEKALRPLKFDDFSGQKNVVENLRVFVEAAKYRESPSTTPFCTVLQDWERPP